MPKFGEDTKLLLTGQRQVIISTSVSTGCVGMFEVVVMGELK